MKPNTEVALALRHVGRKNEPVMVLTGTFVEVIQQFVVWAGKTYMATRFDMCMGRSEEEARKGLTKVGQAEAAETFDLDALTSMMESASSEATIESPNSYDQMTINGDR